jgi:quercetin dioxygenase-like cupin family protein
LQPAPVPRNEWTPLDRTGARGVEARVIFRDATLLVVMLRFEGNATIDEHSADWDIDVVCLEGGGWTSVGGATAELRAGERVRWPRGVPHRLWTAEGAMITLMLERLAG